MSLDGISRYGAHFKDIGVHTPSEVFLGHQKSSSYFEHGVSLCKDRTTKRVEFLNPAILAFFVNRQNNHQRSSKSPIDGIFNQS